MKITSSTSMTSISGVMLMSLIGGGPGLRSRRPKAMAAQPAAGAAASTIISRRSCAKPSSSASLARDPLAEDVVGEHRGDRHRQAGGRHHQRLADRAGDLLDRDRARRRDAEQRVVDAPDGAEQADEGRGAADRGEQHLAELQVRRARACSASRSRRVSCESAWPVASSVPPGGAVQRRRRAAAQHALRGRSAASCSRPLVERRRGPERRHRALRCRAARGAAASPSRRSRPRR